MIFMKNLSITLKILIYVGIFGITCILSMTIISINYVDSILSKTANEHMIAVQSTKKMQLEQFINNKKNAIMALANMPVTIRAINKLVLYNEATPAQKKAAASELTVYSQSFTSYMQANNLSNIIVASPSKGTILYNEKSPITSTEFLISEKNELAEVWRKCSRNKNTQVSDIELSTNGGSPSFYIGSPVIDNGEVIAILIAQVNSAQINKITSTIEGMGETGETYLVGDDYLMRSDSRLSTNSTILKQQVKTIASENARRGNSGTGIILDYRGHHVLSTYSKLDIPGLNWSIITEIDEHEIMTPKRTLTNIIIIICIIIIAVMIPILIFIGRSITRPLKKEVEYALKIANGDLNATININQKDEIGVLADALRTITSKTKSVIIGVMEATGNLSDAGNQLSSSSQSLSSGASEQASSIQEVSASMEEMSANIQHNADNANQTEELSNTVDSQVSEGSKIILTSVSAMERIAEKISIISDIAFQTNILALNASVEAARAGEYGKGFGVVASEVGKLADKTKTAAFEINEISKESVDVAKQTKDVMNQLIPSIQSSSILVQEIAAASKEQRDASNQINNAIQILNDVSQQNAAAAEEMATNSEELSSQAEQLINVISHFKIEGYNKKRKNHREYHKLIEDKKYFTKKDNLNKGINIDLDKDDTLDDEFERF